MGQCYDSSCTHRFSKPSRRTQKQNSGKLVNYQILANNELIIYKITDNLTERWRVSMDALSFPIYGYIFNSRYKKESISGYIFNSQYKKESINGCTFISNLWM